ncbi:hypothetical protein [Sphingomonas faeni]|uniref:hypothetical protein n=1 Tax=Sphingomonas faeni TaxID=185950 RepID=UPI003362D762
MALSLQLWINAFIPKTVPGYTKTLTTGIHRGKTAIPMPMLARFVNYQASDHQGYLTDQRGFDDSLKASVRMRTLLDVRIDGASTLVLPSAQTSGTTGVDLVTGKQNGQGDANMSKCKATVRGAVSQRKDIISRAMLAPTASSIEIDIYGGAGDPLVNFAAEINYEGTFQIITDTAGKTLSVRFAGKLDEFPAFEAYARCNGVTKTLFQSSPPKNNTVMDLLGGAWRPVSGKADFKLA